MARAAMEVNLRGGEMEEGLIRYEPGDEVYGSVTVTPERETRCNHLWVRLQWHTEGRGARDERKIAEQDVFQGTLREGMPSSHEFRFTLPPGPWSYAGHYVTIVWEIAVEVDVPWAVNPRYSQPFVMAPRGWRASSVNGGDE